MPRLHRNNAAEWVMAFALAPITWIIRLWKKVVRTHAGREPGGSVRLSSPKSAAGASAPEKRVKKEKPRRPVTIEGLPPRTMN